jgi:hypothetical protein
MTQSTQPESSALQNLPPEMQARLAQIMAGQVPGNNAPAAPTQPAPVPAQRPIAKAPSLMDHIIALRQEVNELKQQLDANSNVVDAVGQAVGTLYQMFQPSPESHAQGPEFSQGTTYSQNFSQSVDQESDY